ncbi:hydrolase [Streptomyces sp. GQFP]|uniref:hydrolase n=1 Tax=Streptomyces sp. GQFP TaxID=2907545 RepID=UPI001F392137|nr:hydrolase [Streptomyces sp. GQFP]UIX35059.1 hydrolase [Streptomyces sp. GQFP]
MSLWTSLEPSSATVDPGGSTTVRLRLRNTGDVVDEYRFEPVGDIAPWTRVEPQTLRLFPGTTGTVDLTFAPPRTPDATAGPNPYAIRITPTEHPEATTVPEGNLTITAFTEVRAELVPPTVKGRFRGRPKLAVDNLGNTKLTASISGSDNGDNLSYDIHPGSVQVEPGRAVFVDARLKPRQIIWFGSKEDRPYTLAVQRSGAVPIDVDGTYVQRGFLPRWLATFLGIFLALAITFVMLWISYKPQFTTKATELTEVGSANTLPPPSPTAVATAPPVAPSQEPAQDPVVSAPPQASETPAAGGGSGDGDGGGGGTPKETKAPEVTAATAVTQLAARSAGRHICYRAYVADQGWQEPVCDGAEAGTTGKDLPIKALNIAVSGTKGTAGNGAWQYKNWEGTKWTKAVDGIDNYLGSTKEADEPLQGFTIQVFDGSVCGNPHVQDGGWLGVVCTDAGGWKYIGSNMEQHKQLEAVRFTV